jgi:hypothetical protein
LPSDKVRGKDYTISRLAFELAKKEGVRLEDLIHSGSGEGKKILENDVRRVVHPPRFHAIDIAERLKLHLNAKDLDSSYEKKFGSRGSNSLSQPKGVSTSSAEGLFSSEKKPGLGESTSRRTGRPRKAGEVIRHVTSRLASKTNRSAR